MSATMVGHVILGVVITVFGLLHRRDLKRITIEFRNGNGKTKDDDSKGD